MRDAFEDPRDAGKRQAGEVRRVRGKAEHEIRVILQVLADALQVMHGRDAEFRERAGIADAGQHQQLGRLERAGGKDHFAGADLPRLIALTVFDPTARLSSNRIRVACAWISTRRLARGYGARGAPALAVLLYDLIAAEAFLLFGIEVVADAELRRARCLQIDLAHRVVGAQSRDMEGAALAVIGAIELGIIFRTLE